MVIDTVEGFVDGLILIRGNVIKESQFYFKGKVRD